MLCRTRNECNFSGYERRKSYQENAKRDCSQTISLLFQPSKEKNLKCTMVLGHGKHIGETICTAIEAFHIDHVILGRRNITDVRRILVGSTSRYVVENAPCTVAVVKQAYGAPITQRVLATRVQKYQVTSINKRIVTNEEKELQKIKEGKLEVSCKDAYVMYSFSLENPLSRKEVTITKNVDKEIKDKEEREDVRHKEKEKQKKELEKEKEKEKEKAREKEREKDVDREKRKAKDIEREKEKEKEKKKEKEKEKVVAKTKTATGTDVVHVSVEGQKKGKESRIASAEVKGVGVE